MIFQQMKSGTSVIPYFHVILTGKSISSTIFMTQGLAPSPVSFHSFSSSGNFYLVAYTILRELR